MAASMQAVVCRRPQDIGLDRRPMAVAGAGDVLLKICRAGICGTDYHIFAGLHPFLEYPRVLGHELSGTVEAAPASSGFAKGQLVVVNPYVSCGDCHACRIGKPNCCTRIAVLGVHRDGGMSEYLSLPQGNLIAADGLSEDQAASVEFLAIGAHAVQRGRVLAGHRVLVIGAGPIGIGAALFADLAGAVVTIMDRDEQRLALVAAATGLRDHILADEQMISSLASATRGEGFDVVFEATGNPRSMESSFDHVAHGGVLVLVGLVKSSISFDDPEFHRREMSVVASRNALSADFLQVMSAIREGRIDVDRLITHRTTLSRISSDLPHWAKDKTGLIKAMVEFA